jgi:hypothetical protein
MAEDKSDGRDFVVVLVHGTWARGAEWIGPTSTFCTTLIDELNNLSARSIAIIRDFEWTGGTRMRIVARGRFVFAKS